MAGFNLTLLSGNQEQHFNDVLSFVGEDASGSFGIQAHHAYFMTTLVFGLARFRLATGQWHYLALPGGLLSFKSNHLTLSTHYFLVNTDFEQISQALEQLVVQEQKNLHITRNSLQRMELAIMQRLRVLKSKPEW